MRLDFVISPRKLVYFAQGLVLSVTSVLLGLLILEAGATIAARASDHQRIMGFDSRLGWKLLPNVTKHSTHESQPYTIRTNMRGLRDRDYSYDKPTSIFRVVVLGDSQTFGSGGVSTSETFSKRLENFRTDIQVINMGVPGFSTDQEYRYLEQGLKCHPESSCRRHLCE